MELGPMRYATTTDGLSIAYRQWGEGERNIVLVPGTVWHSDFVFDLPPHRRFAERLGSLGRVVTFDKRGTGLSDRHLGGGSLDDRVGDISAVMDDAGIEHATIMGLSEGGSMGALFAASVPTRVDSLVLGMGLLYGPFCAHHPRPERARRYGERMLEQLMSTWGSGTATAMWMDGPGQAPDSELLSRVERYMFTPRGIVEFMGRNMEIDVRPVLPLIGAPTLVVHAIGDTIIPFVHARLAAATIPGAELVALDLDYHGAWKVDGFDPYVDAFERWFTGRPPQPPPRLERVLSTVLFTDIVGSTELASQLGDAQWRQTLETHDRLCARALTRYGGTRVKSTGDGVLATFDGPTRALDCARSLRDQLRTEGLHIRAGVHTGEIEVRDDEDISGIAVHLAARVMAKAADDEIWVSPTIPGLVVGSGHRFEARGTHALKGMPGEWPLACLAER